jgi:hypothetical protein
VVREQLGERMKSKLVMFFAAMLIPFSLLSMALSENLNDLEAYLDQTGLLMILAPLLGCAYFLNKANGQHWQETFLALGVPLSLICAYQGAMLLTFYSNQTANLIGANSSVMLLAVLYGGVIGAMGYPALHRKQSSKKKHVNKRFIVISLFLVLFATYLSMRTILGINAIGMRVFDFFDISLFLIFGLLISSFLLMNRKERHWSVVVSDAALYGSIITTVLALIYWFRAIGADPDSSMILNPILYASQSMYLGSIIYVITYIASLGADTDDRIDVGKMNWHLIEANAFVLFLAFAPPSIGEFTSSLNGNSVQEEIIEGLTRRLEILER